MFFQSVKLGSCQLKNNFMRSATFEGMCDAKGIPNRKYKQLYTSLARGGVGGIITGFTYISQEGKAMQPGQAGIDSLEKIKYYAAVTDEVHKYDSKIFMQLAHTGRQTRQQETNHDVVGVSQKKSFYFKGCIKQLSTQQIYDIIDQFAQAAVFAKKAGFDGIQLHAAHGYLIHQFILPAINNRKDIFGIDRNKRIGIKFMELVIDAVRDKCGKDFVLLIKVSGSDDYFNTFSKKQFKNLILFLDSKKVDGIEISYGTMDYALNIFRGEIPLEAIMKYNPVYKSNHAFTKFLFKTFVYPFIKLKIKPFTSAYNMPYAKIAKKWTDIPIICVGGFRNGDEIKACLNAVDLIGLCRPLLCEPDFIIKIKQNPKYRSKCINCNLCAIMCDTNKETRCYRRNENEYE